MPTNTSTADLARRRLTSQRIENAQPRDGDGAGGTAQVSAVVSHLLAVQAQDFAQAVWAVGLRTPGASRSDVLEALDNGSVVRTAPMRGTLHFVAAADLRWMLDLTSARTLSSTATRRRQLDLDDETLDRSAAIALEVLQNNPLSRDEFMKALEAGGVSTAGQRGYHIVFELSQKQLVCWGPSRANQQAIVLVDEWVPQAPPLLKSEGLRRFVVRYFAGHGPATLQDFVWWSKLTVADAKAGLELAREELAGYTHEGTQYWMAIDEADAAASASSIATAQPTRTRPVMHLLPGFDEYLLGYQQRGLTLPPEHATRVAPGANGIFLPIMVWKGQVVGTWRRPNARNGWEATAEPFDSLTATQTAAFTRAAARYSTFVQDEGGR